MSDGDRPAMPPPDEPAEKRSHKKRGRPPATPVEPTPDAGETRLAAAQANGAALAPYLAAVLEAVESAAGLHGVDPEKRAADAGALATATAYTFPVIDPMWLLWGAAAAATLDAYKSPVQNMGKPARLASVPTPATPVATT